MKEEALELADFLEKNMVASVAILGDVTATHIVSTIRRLVEELDKQDKPVAWSCWNEDMVDLPAIILFTEPDKYEWQSIKPLYTTPQTKPLSDEEIQVLINNVPDYDIGIYDLFKFARAIEERHGIK